MSLRRCIITLLLATPLCIAAQQDAVKPIRFNIGIKAGFHALTYSDPEFEIEGYTFDKNCIHSNRIGYTVSPFVRFTYRHLYLQSEAMLGTTYHNFNFNSTPRSGEEEIYPNSTEYNLRSYSLQIPILIGYNFVDQKMFGMSVFTGPRTKFIFTSHSKQEFKHFDDNTLHEVLCKKCYYWEIGLGVKIDKVFFDFVYDIGLSDASRYIVSEKDGRKFKSSRRDSVLSFSVGLIF